MPFPEDFRFRTHYLGDFATEPKVDYAKRYNDAVEELAKLQAKQDAGGKLGSVQAKNILELPEQINQLYKLKDTPNFSQTVKRRLNKCKREILYNITENLDNKYVQKGLMCEEDAITLNSKLEGVMMVKNKEKFQNHLIAGECDIRWNSKTLGKVIDDTKVSYSAQSFDDTTTVKKIYYWQGEGYMWGYEADYARIVHVLVNTPPELVIAEHNNILYKHKPQGTSLEDFSYSDAGTQIRTQYFRNHTYTDSGWIDNGQDGFEFLQTGYWDYLTETYLLDSRFKFVPIPDNQRRKVFQFKRNNDDIAYIEKKLILARSELKRMCEDNSEMIYDLTKDDFEN